MKLVEASLERSSKNEKDEANKLGAVKKERPSKEEEMVNDSCENYLLLAERAVEVLREMDREKETRLAQAKERESSSSASRL